LSTASQYDSDVWPLLQFDADIVMESTNPTATHVIRAYPASICIHNAEGSRCFPTPKFPVGLGDLQHRFFLFGSTSYARAKLADMAKVAWRLGQISSGRSICLEAFKRKPLSGF
jgi:hypothetical protein